MAVIMMQMDQFQAALDCLHESLDLSLLPSFAGEDRDKADIYGTMADLLTDLGRFEEAAEVRSPASEPPSHAPPSIFKTKAASQLIGHRVPGLGSAHGKALWGIRLVPVETAKCFHVEMWLKLLILVINVWQAALIRRCLLCS